MERCGDRRGVHPARTLRWGFNAIRYIPRNPEQSHWVPGLLEWFRIAGIGAITGLDLTEAVTKSTTFIPYVQGALQEGQVRWRLDLTNDEEFKAEEPGLFERDFRNSLNQVKLTFDDRTGAAVSAYYGRGVNFGSNLDQLGAAVEWTITDELTAAYDLQRVSFDPDPSDRSSFVHFVRATYYVNKDMFFKAFYQTRYDLTDALSSPQFELERETIQLLYVWRIFPPFGSLQLAWQEGPAQFDDELVNYRTLFTKLSWVF